MPQTYYRYTLVFIMILAFSFSSSAQTWRQVGPQGGDVQSLAAVAGSTRNLFLGTSDGHVFGSRDSGEHWEILGRIGQHHDAVIMSMIVDSRSSSVLYATSWTFGSKGGGVYRSADAGHTWQLIGLDGLVVRAIAAAPSNPDTLVAGATDGVYRSDDSGKHWARISPENHDDLRNFDSIAIDAHDPNTIYAGTYHLPWKTTDGGKTWAPIHQGMVDDSDVMSITIDQGNSSHVFASACSGIYHSSDGGANWTKFKGIPKDSRRTVHILQDPNRPLTVYAATTEGLWKTADDGANWKLITPASWSILSMLIDPVNSDRLILGTERLGVHVSDNGGQTYHAENQGFSHRRIVDAAIDPVHSERAVVVLTSNFEPMLETNDAGRTWTPLATGLKSGPPRHVFASPQGWFAAPGPGGLLRYDTSRSTWLPVNLVVDKSASVTRPATKIKSSKNSTGAASKPTGAQVVTKSTIPLQAKVNDMAFGRDVWYAATDQGLMISHDSGLNWSADPFSPAQSSSVTMAASTTPVRAVRVGNANSYVWAITSKQLEISGDAGKTWIARSLPYEPRGPLHFQAADENNLALASDHGVFTSRDAGESWRQANLSELLIDEMTPLRDVVVVSAANGSMFLSSDTGKTWRRLNSPDAESSVSALRSREAGNQLVAATATEGLFVLDMGSASSASADSIVDSLAPKQ
jgi:photosystem II stability/assembly factor-like uncharacterized protein